MLKMYNDDCVNRMTKMQEESVLVDAIITDPPYNISKKNNFATIKNAKGSAKYGSIDFGEWDKGFEEYKWLECAIPLLRTGGNIIIFCNWKQLTTYTDILEQNGCIVKNMLQWVKPNSAPKNRDRLYIVNYEVAIWATKGKGWVFNRQDEKKQCSQFIYPFVSGKEKTKHPTQKPVKLMEDLVKIHTNEGDVVLDPFMGSGSTGVASRRIGRGFIGIERDVQYFEIATERVKEVTV